MPDADASVDLDVAVRAFHEARHAVPAAEAAARQLVSDARMKVEAKRLDLAAAIVRAAAAGMRQRDVVAATGYSREHIRRIWRDAGVEPPAE